MNSWPLHVCLMRERYRRAFVLPNYAPPAWWECDVFELTGAGYFREYEVKVSLADFKADQAKDRPDTSGGHRSWDPACPRVSKHQLLERAHPAGPCEFWYVCPEGLIEPQMLPPWAGLIWCVQRSPKYRPDWYDERVIVRAPRLHRTKAPPGYEKHARSVIYYRLHNALQTGEKPNEMPDEVDGPAGEEVGARAEGPNDTAVDSGPAELPSRAQASASPGPSLACTDWPL